MIIDKKNILRLNFIFYTKIFISKINLNKFFKKFMIIFLNIIKNIIIL